MFSRLCPWNGSQNGNSEQNVHAKCRWESEASHYPGPALWASWSSHPLSKLLQLPTILAASRAILSVVQPDGRKIWRKDKSFLLLAESIPFKQPSWKYHTKVLPTLHWSRNHTVIPRCKEGWNCNLLAGCKNMDSDAKKEGIHGLGDLCQWRKQTLKRKLKLCFSDFISAKWSRTFYGRPNFVTSFVLFLTVCQIVWLKEYKSVAYTILNALEKRPLTLVSVCNFMCMFHPFCWLHGPLFCYKLLCDLLKNVLHPH